MWEDEDDAMLDFEAAPIDRAGSRLRDLRWRSRRG
jgi:hypothetical protein